MDQRIINLYDRFTHGYIDRRTFSTRLTKLAGDSSTTVGTVVMVLKEEAKEISMMSPAPSAPVDDVVNPHTHVDAASFLPNNITGFFDAAVVQDELLRNDIGAHDSVAAAKLHTPYTASAAAHRADVRLFKSY